MRLEARTVDGEIQIRDLDTDNADIVAIVPLTGDEATDKDRVAFADLIVARGNSRTVEFTRERSPIRLPGSSTEPSIRGDVRIINRNILVVATRTVGGWKAYIGTVAGRDHNAEWRGVLDCGDTLNEGLARFLYPEFQGSEYDR